MDNLLKPNEVKELEDHGVDILLLKKMIKAQVTETHNEHISKLKQDFDSKINQLNSQAK